MGSQQATAVDDVAAVLKAAAALKPEAGFVNGDYFSDWHVRAAPELLRALSGLARSRDEDLADRLEQISYPLCMEPLDAVLTDWPQSRCGVPVEKEGQPCEHHTPEHAAELGRCTWPAESRICLKALAWDDDRCAEHAGRCRAVKLDGAVCGQSDCRIPKHRREPSRHTVSGGARS